MKGDTSQASAQKITCPEGADQGQSITTLDKFASDTDQPARLRPLCVLTIALHPVLSGFAWSSEWTTLLWELRGAGRIKRLCVSGNSRGQPFRLLQRDSHRFEFEQRISVGLSPALAVSIGGEAVVDDSAEWVPHVSALVVSKEVVGQQHIAALRKNWARCTEVRRAVEQAGVSALRLGSH
jgi:hypothetical protein